MRSPAVRKKGSHPQSGSGSTVFIPNYNNLFVGENTVKITFTAKPTESALKNGYTEEQTMFTATVNYKVNALISHKGISAQIADAPTAGMKTLTVQGLTANRSYRIAARGGESGKVNYRDGVTDGNGTFTSSWYTDYSFDHCTIEEWAVSVVLCVFPFHQNFIHAHAPQP